MCTVNYVSCFLLSIFVLTADLYLAKLSTLSGICSFQFIMFPSWLLCFARFPPVLQHILTAQDLELKMPSVIYLFLHGVIGYLKYTYY